MPEQTDPTKTVRWKIDKDLDLYKFYLDTSIKAFVFLMTVTGAIASYVVANGRSEISSIGLFFPALMNGGFAVLFFYSIKQARRLYRHHRRKCNRIGISSFNMLPLRSICQIFSALCAFATIGLIALAVLLIVAEPAVRSR